MARGSKRSSPPQAPTPSAGFSAPIAILALGVLGGYAAMVLLPAVYPTGTPLWQVALGATVVTVLAAAWAIRNCVPFGQSPWRGRSVAALCVLGCLATGLFTQQLHAYETSPAPPRTADGAEAQQQAPPPLAFLFKRTPIRRSAN